MLVFLSARRLKGGHWEDFRKAWDPGDDARETLPDGSAIYHARNVKDEDEVISFGIFPVDPASISTIRGDEETELKRQEAMAKHVHDIPLEGVYEVIEEIKP
ncbi:MAG: hypothetical protein ACJ75Z_04655 [Solirubrobacterales bacterium]